MPKNKPFVSEDSLREAFEEYYDYLDKELDRMNDNEDNDSYFYSVDEYHQTDTRYSAIRDLLYISTSKSNYFTPNSFSLEDAKNTVQFCIKNNPTWGELSILRKIIDILSMGTLPLYRSIFSPDKSFQKNLSKQLDEYEKQLPQSKGSNQDNRSADPKGPKLSSNPEESDESDESSTNTP